MRRALSRFAVPLVAALAFAAPARAQSTEFDPRVFLVYSYTTNADVVDNSLAEESDSDSLANVGFELPVSRELRAGTLDFSYGAAYTRYDRNSAYDNTAHRASLTFSPRLRRGATLSTNLYYVLSQEQGTAQSIDDAEQFLSARTDRTFYGAALQYQKDARRSFWETRFSGTRAEFEVIEGTLPDAPPTDPQVLALVPESRTFWYGSFEFRHKFSRRFSLGPRYELGYSQLERNTDELFHVLSAAFGWVVSEHVEIDASLGAYRRESEGDEPLGAELAETSGFAWVLTLRIDPPLAAIQKGKIKLGLDVGISPHGGGSLAGTSTDSYVWVYLESGTRRSPWSWEVGTRYTRRDSSLDAFPTVETAGASGDVEYGFGRLLSARLMAGYTEQLSVQTGATNASYGTAGIGLVVYPRGRTAGEGSRTR